MQAAAKVSVPVRITSSAANTLAMLEQLRAAMRARQAELIADGIRAGWPVDVHATRLRIGVVGLTPEKARTSGANSGQTALSSKKGKSSIQLSNTRSPSESCLTSPQYG